MNESFEWDEQKNIENQEKHKISFEEAQYAFTDNNRLILRDTDHSNEEQRYFCIARISTGIVTVRFTLRNGTIRIFGAGIWRKYRKLYLVRK